MALAQLTSQENCQQTESLLRLLFAPDYEPINVPLVYDGKDVHLPPEAVPGQQKESQRNFSVRPSLLRKKLLTTGRQ